MNLTPWETINEAINAGAKFWSVYDQSGKRLIFELQQETAPEDSADKLRAILNREAGEFVQVKLSFQSTKEKGNGGNTRGFTYFYKLPNPGGSFASQPQFNNSIGGISLSDYVNVIEQKNAAEREKLKMELQKEAAPSFAERIATPENVSKFFEIAGALVNSLNKQNVQPPLLNGAAQFDAETVKAVNTLLSFEDGKAALVNIAAAGPLVWQMIHAGLKENKLLP